MISKWGLHWKIICPSQLGPVLILGDHTLVLNPMTRQQRRKCLEMEGAQNVEVLTRADRAMSLESLDPYGAELVTYGICL